jgi:hypothetical protein
MIPSQNCLQKLINSAKYFLLEDGDIILKGDEYYNNFKDKWLPVQKDFIGYTFSNESKPVRRKNINFKTN